MINHGNVQVFSIDGITKKSPSVRLVRSIMYIEYVRYISNNFFNKGRKARYGNVYVILGVLSSRLLEGVSRYDNLLHHPSELRA